MRVRLNEQRSIIEAQLTPRANLHVHLADTEDYNLLINKPSINGTVLMGDTTIVEDKNYIHMQERPKAVWTVVHGLGKYPSVTVIDSAGNEVVGDTEFIDINTVRLTFSGAFSGKAIFN